MVGISESGGGELQILFVQMSTDAAGKARCGSAGQTDPQDSPESNLQTCVANLSAAPTVRFY